MNGGGGANKVVIGRLKPADAVEVLSWMSTEGQIEWEKKEKDTTTTTTTTTIDKSAFYIYWRRVEEWANIIYDWVLIPPPSPSPLPPIWRGGKKSGRT